MTADRFDKRRLNPLRRNIVPITLTLFYAATYTYLGLLRFGSYHASCDDGLFLQSISTAFHGFHNAPEGASHFAYHFSPILYLLAPSVWLWQSAIPLIAIQALAGALTIPAVYGIAIRRLPTVPEIIGSN